MSMMKTLGHVARELENISSQIQTIEFLSVPRAKNGENAMTEDMYIGFLMAIEDHIARLVAECEEHFSEE